MNNGKTCILEIITTEKLRHKLDLHSKYVNGEEGGKKADFRRREFRNCDFGTNRIYGIDFSNSNFIGGSNTLIDTTFNDCIFDRSCLNASDIRNASFEVCSLKKVLMKYVRADFTTFMSCDLSEADFSYSNLHHAAFEKSNMTGILLDGVIGNSMQIKSLQIHDYHITYTSTHLQIGCQQFPISQWFKFTYREIRELDRTFPTKAENFWRKHKALIKNIIETSPAI